MTEEELVDVVAALVGVCEKQQETIAALNAHTVIVERVLRLLVTRFLATEAIVKVLDEDMDKVDDFLAPGVV